MENKKENVNLDESTSKTDKENDTKFYINNNDQKNLMEEIKELSRQEDNNLFLHLKRKSPEKNWIIYNSSSKRILNSYCSPEENSEEFQEKDKNEEMNINNNKNQNLNDDKVSFQNNNEIISPLIIRKYP